jgi:capsular polysaccharide transport system permease protein
MTENRATPIAGDVPLGARARSILKTLAETGPAKLAGDLAARRDAKSERRQAEAPRAASEGERTDPQAGRAARRLQRAMAAASAGAPAEPAAAPVNTVVPLPRRALPGRPLDPDAPAPIRAAAPATAKGKKSYIKISALLAIALPTLLASIYFGLIASPQYVAEARFAVRGPDDMPAPTDALGALTGLGTTVTSTTSDSYIVTHFIESAQLVGNLQRSLDLRGIYTSDKADFVAKYRPYDFEDTIEHLTTFWNSVSWNYFEPISGTITFTVRAFTPEDALKIARETVRESEKLVNKLSERAREDAISLAKMEQARAELRLKAARKAVQDYRDRKGQTDPVTTAAAKSALIATLEQELAKQEADIAGRTAFLNKDAPSVRVLRQTADAIRSQIEQERAKIGNLQTGEQQQLMSASLTEFEGLQTERDFAQRAYETAATAVESARMRAGQQSRYLATYVEPHLPEDSLYPARLQMVLLVLLCATMAWAIGVLVFYGIRDHTA